MDTKSLETQKPDYLFLLHEALHKMQAAKPNDRSERDRLMAIAKTDLEKLIAYIEYFLG